MLVSPKQKPYLLTEHQNRLLFLEQILPDAFDETETAAAPKAIFLGGQPGSGKSGLSMAVQRMFSDVEQAVVINSDALREYHPDFSILQKTDVNQASFLVNPDTVIWQKKLIEAAVSSRRNLILDGTLGGSPEPIKETAEMLHENGYFVQISVLAVPARLSRFGIYKRYEDQVKLKGAGRWVGMENHDRLYQEISNTLIVLEEDDFVDCVQVFTRLVSGFSLLYKNEKESGRLRQAPLAYKALWKGRDRVWSSEEQAAFSVAVQTVAEQMHQRGVSQDDIDNFYRYVE